MEQAEELVSQNGQAKTSSEIITLVQKHGQQQGVIVLIPQPDGQSGLYKGIPFNWEELRRQGKDVETPDSEFRVKAGTPVEFNLAIQKVANIWDWVKYNPWVAASKEELKYKPEALLYPDEPEKELQEKIKVGDIKFELESWIRESSHSDQIRIGRFLGRRLETVSPSEIKDYLLSLAKGDKYTDLVKIKQEFDNGDSKYKTFLFNLEDLRICTKHKHSGLKHGDIVIGDNLDECIKWMKDPKSQEEILILRAKMEAMQVNGKRELKEMERLEDLKTILDFDPTIKTEKEETL